MTSDSAPKHSEDWDIGKLLSTSVAYWKGCALQTAVRLRLFTILAETEMDVKQVAQQAETDTRATAMLLDAVTAMGLLTKEKGLYSNTKFSKSFLVAESVSYMGHIILHHHHILDGWAQLDRSVKTGKSVERRGYGEEIERESFLMGMFNLANSLAPQLASQISLSGSKKLLDLGGGPGTYAIHFCRANPGLEAIIFDRPTTRPFAEETVAKHRLSGRISFLGGDFNKDAITGGPYDVAWMSHILHSNSREQCEKFLAKVAGILTPGGRIIIHDFIMNDAKDGPEFPALFSLNMLVGTEGGSSYSCTEIFSMLEKTGFVEISHQKLQVPNDSSIITAKKP